MNVLVPVHYPLNSRNKRAIARGLELVATASEPELLVVHVNLLHKTDRVDQNALQDAVEAEFGTVPAHYVVRDGLLYEAAILDEAIRKEADHVVISERRRGAWQRLLREALDIEVDLAAFLAEHLDAELHVVADDQ